MAKAKKRRSSLPVGRTASEQFSTAQRRVLDAQTKSSEALDFSDLKRLRRLPDEISDLNELQSLSLRESQISDLAPISRLSSLRELILDRSKVHDLAALSQLKSMRILSVDHTDIHSLSGIENLRSLESLSLKETVVVDLDPIKDLVGLERLSFDSTKVLDLSAIASLTNLQVLSFDDTAITDISYVGGLSALTELSLCRARVTDISALKGLKAIRILRLNGLQIRDISALQQIRHLWRLWLSSTLVSDLSPLRLLSELSDLWLTGTLISDLTPISGLMKMNDLRVDGTKVRDLSPICRMTSLQDAAVEDFEPLTEGLHFAGSEAANIPPFDALVQLNQPACTVETINELRRRNGLAEHLPEGYEPLAVPTVPPSDRRGDDDIEDHEQLIQKPASHSFSLRSGRIEAQPQIFQSKYPDIARDIRAEVSAKASTTLSRMKTCNAPSRLLSTVDRLQSSLGVSLEDVRAGILQMRFRSLEADITAYDTEEGRREIPEDALAMLRDLTSSVEDLMGCFPQLADIEAERLAQRLKDEDTSEIIDALAEIRTAAETNEIVASSAVEALRTGEVELLHDTEIIQSQASDAVRVAAINARDRTIGYMLLVYRNFVAGTVKAGNELAGLGGETWKDFRHKAPEQLSDAALALTIAGLVAAILGPTAALGAFAVSFKPLRERAKKTTERLKALAKKGRVAAEPVDDQGEN